ncbi:hypothetical protein DDZ14_09445 [Maritimibacter sp. 55A14]|uniref:DUF1326 domain-containing protein n=1 Tax=Maritimibacter sp. 55A14 TaxID=2174844 RepID=UPI000D60F728|nr:DUF1326 domain-containing protein [Maritimibacter sp. 55A14]PWE32608.1 hypothetical protein DDZ14_09445 [Maritimibacter sp. 55A14]
MAYRDWYIEGREFGNCNCIDGCPCQFEGIPTNGGCHGFEVVEITKGYFGDVPLDELRFGLIYAWPGPIYEGKGQMQVLIDERADAAQREALETVLHGGETEPETTHWWIFHAMCDTVHDPIHTPIAFEVDIDARTAKVSIPGVLESSGYPIEAPHGGGKHRVRIQIPDGIEFEVAEIGKASTTASGAIPMNLKDSYGQFNILRHGPGGVVH